LSKSKGGLKGMLFLAKIRPLVMMSDKDCPLNMSWQCDVPYDTRQEAIKDAITAMKGCLTKLKNGQIKHFQLHFKTKKHPIQSFKVNKKALNPETFTIFPKRLKDKSLRLRKRDIKKWLEDDTLDGNFTITRSNNDKWYICLPRTKKKEKETSPIKESVFLDPGVRSFQTFYSPDGVCGKIGHNFVKDELDSLALRHDKLWSLLEKAKSKTKTNLKRRCQTIRQKIKNKVSALHNQTCSFLNNFKHVFLPHFDVIKLSDRESSLSSSITRKMLQLSHGTFREKVKEYRRRKGLYTWIVGEEYTTQTCSSCGERQVMKDLKVYECGRCQVRIDRDYNGAKNICLLLAKKFI